MLSQYALSFFDDEVLHLYHPISPLEYASFYFPIDLLSIYTASAD